MFAVSNPFINYKLNWSKVTIHAVFLNFRFILKKIINVSTKIKQHNCFNNFSKILKHVKMISGGPFDTKHWSNHCCFKNSVLPSLETSLENMENKLTDPKHHIHIKPNITFYSIYINSICTCTFTRIPIEPHQLPFKKISLIENVGTVVLSFMYIINQCHQFLCRSQCHTVPFEQGPVSHELRLGSLHQ